ncbi:MAG: septum formation protein Maf [Lachnospiraceae bacterium]|nr:septum formation protein Maf [Lachnospiraceae bacterium]
MRQLYPCYLASASPRRREILTMLGLDFTVEVSEVSEETFLTDPAQIVTELAKRKALAVADAHANENCIVIGSDTVVYAGGKVLGKPASKEEAKEMLRLLSGKPHTVFTGLCIVLIENGAMKVEALADAAHVIFEAMSEEEIEWYAGTGEPMDKAGAYAIQGLGGRFVKSIEGDFYTIMGLPMHEVYKKLREMNLLFP